MKTNINLLAAELKRLLPELARDSANAEATILGIIKPLADERDGANKDVERLDWLGRVTYECHDFNSHCNVSKISSCQDKGTSIRQAIDKEMK